MTRYELPLCQRYTPSSSQPSAPDDPAPLVSSLLWKSEKELQAKPGSCASLLDKHRNDPSFSVYTRQSLDKENPLNENRPLNVSNECRGRSRVGWWCGGRGMKGGACWSPGATDAWDDPPAPPPQLAGLQHMQGFASWRRKCSTARQYSNTPVTAHTALPCANPSSLAWAGMPVMDVALSA